MDGGAAPSMKILVVQTGFLGDIVLSTPVFSAMLRRHPGAEIHLLTTAGGRELVKHDPVLSKIHIFDKRREDAGIFGIFKRAAALRSERYDRVYALHKSARTALLLWLAQIPVRIGVAGASLSFLYTELRKRNEHLHDVLRRLDIIAPERPLELCDMSLSLVAGSELSITLPQSKPIAVVAPGSVWATKRWTTEGYRRVCQDLARRGFQVYVTGAPEDSAVCAQVVSDDFVETGEICSLAGKLPLDQFVTLVSRSQLMVCNDSSALHIASAFKVPTVAIFCATTPAFGFGPWQSWARVVQRDDLSCRPCARHGGNRCPTGTELCMRGVSSSQVIEAIDRVFELNKSVFS
jgi:heptosyltransferase-2